MSWLWLRLAGLASGAIAWCYRPATAATVDYRHPRILMYHMVSDHMAGAKFNKLRVTPAHFEEQIRWLREQGWHFATMSELVGTTGLPDKTVAITFDDGFRDNYTQAFPILQKYNARATLYLVVDRHDRDWSTYKKAHHNTGELMREPKLVDADVQKMIESGVFELGAHTLTHANLHDLDTTSKVREIGASKAALETTFNTRISSFAYPFGIYDQADVDAVRQAGFDTAVTTVEGIDEQPGQSLFELKRVKISGKDTLRTFITRMRQGQR